jgi:hypothetical protein
MTIATCQHCDRLIDLVEGAHERALVAFTTPDADFMSSIGWLSAHLAAVERVLHPALVRHLPEAAELLRDDHEVTHRLAHLLRLLERRMSGDATAARLDPGQLRSEVLATLVGHAATEHALLDRLARVIGPAATDELATRYQRALELAPTRPHPHAPSHGHAGAVAFRLTALRDRVLDTLDGRVTGTPKRRRPIRAQRRG